MVDGYFSWGPSRAIQCFDSFGLRVVEEAECVAATQCQLLLSTMNDQQGSPSNATTTRLGDIQGSRCGDCRIRYMSTRSASNNAALNTSVCNYLHCLLYGGSPNRLRPLMVARPKRSPWLHIRQICGWGTAGIRCRVARPCSSQFASSIAVILFFGRKTSKALGLYASTSGVQDASE